ncbi:MAG: hypothetical protein ACOYN4_05240 [Bacteroidales bacterium]
MKTFSINYNVGRSKYLVSFKNGIDKYKDGSDCLNINIFSNKKKMGKFISQLTTEGYIKS